MKTKFNLYDAAGELVHAGEIVGVPDVIFFGVRAFYSPLPLRGRYDEVSCARIADTLVGRTGVAVTVGKDSLPSERSVLAGGKL